MRRGIRAASALFLSFLFSLSTAVKAGSGNGKFTVTILPLPNRQVPPQIQDQILASTSRMIRSQYGAKVLSGRAVGRAVWGTLGSGLEEAAMNFTSGVTAGQKAYRLLQIEEAVERLEEAQQWQEFCGPEIRNTDLFVNLHLYAGLSFLAQGEEIKAAAAFRQAVSHDPDLVLSKRKFPPDVLEAFERARRQVFAEKPTQVSLVSRPAGAAVYIDGKFRGTTPSASIPLYPGRHFVRLELEGYAPWTLNLPDSAPPKQVKALMVPLWTGDPPEELMSLAITAENLEEPHLAQLRLLAGFFRAGALVLLHVTLKDHNYFMGVRVFVVQPETITRARLFNLGTNPKELEKKIEGVVATMIPLKKVEEDPVVAVTPAFLRDPPPDENPQTDPDPVPPDPLVDPANKGWVKPPDTDNGSTPWFKSWWFWTLTGLAVAGGATGVTLWLLQPSGSWTLVIK